MDINIKLPTFHSGQLRAYLNRTRFFVLRCGRRWGKALALDTPIPTPSGWATMGELKEGDWVFDERGAPCQVTYATEIQYGRPCNRVIFSDGSEIVADDNHRWLTWDKSARKNTARGYPKSPQVRTTKEIRETLTFGSKEESNHSIPTAALQGSDADFIVPPYVLGVWLGDGSTANSQLTCADAQIVEELRSQGQSVNKIGGDYMWYMGANGEGVSLASRLKKIGVIGSKHIPKEYLRGSYKQRLELLQGLMDTDGTIGMNGACEYVSTRLELIEGVLELVLSMGIRATMQEHRSTLYGKDCGPKWRIRFSTSLSVFKLIRKLERIKYRVNENGGINHRFIVDVQPIASVPVRCITVDSPNHLYLAGKQFIPTHNTDMSKILAGDAVTKGRNVGIFVPSYKILTEVYNDLYDLLLPILVSSSKSEWVMRFKGGGRIDFWSLENERAGRSRKYHLVIIDEAAFTKSNMMMIWETAIKPTLLDYHGAAFVMSTPDGIDAENFFYSICRDPTNRYGFREFHAPTKDNPYMPREDVEALKKQYPPKVYQQEFLAEFVDWGGDAFLDYRKFLLEGEVPVAAYPQHVEFVYAVIDTAVKDGQEHDGTGVVYFAKNKFGKAYPLTILDWDIKQMQGAMLETWLPTVFQRCEYLAEKCSARFGSAGVFIEDKMSGAVLLQQSYNHGWNAHPINSKLTEIGKDARAIYVSGYVHNEQCKMYAEAYDKTTDFKMQHGNHLLMQIKSFYLNDKNAAKRADDLFDCVTYGLAIGMDESAW